jgi:hypothetical protein
MQTLQCGPFTLTRREDGQIELRLPALREPVLIPESQLARWLMRQVREQITFK